MDKKIFLITGASSGIGASSAVHLASLGHTVYGAARRIEKLKELESKGVIPVQLDVSDTAKIKPAIDNIIKKEGRIDVLVNNAGYGCYGPLENVTIEEARRQFEVNLFGLAEVTKAVLPSMRSKKQGRIINISSVGGVATFPLGGWYHASKFALEGWSDVLRIELFKFNIPVIVIRPGLIATEFGEAMEMASMTDTNDTNSYSDLINAMNKSRESMIKTASDPIVIAKVIAQASLSKKPKTRYRAGGMAKTILFIRKAIKNDVKYTRTIFNMFKIKVPKNYNL